MVGIKGMKMPKSCSECQLNYDCCSCIITGTVFNFDKADTERLADCPLTDEYINKNEILNKSYLIEVEDMWHMKQNIDVVNVEDIK